MLCSMHLIVGNLTNKTSLQVWSEMVAFQFDKRRILFQPDCTKFNSMIHKYLHSFLHFSLWMNAKDLCVWCSMPARCRAINLPVYSWTNTIFQHLLVCSQYQSQSDRIPFFCYLIRERDWLKIKQNKKKSTDLLLSASQHSSLAL